MMDTPCAHLIEESPIHQLPVCEIGRAFPSDCGSCPAYSPGLTEQERTRCEVWTRVMGYHRPVHAFNAGKQQEHRERQPFRERPLGLVGERQTVLIPAAGPVDQPSVQTPRIQFMEGAGHD